MHRRDLIKKKAISSSDHDIREQFKCARNQAIIWKLAKATRGKTSSLINEVSSRNTSKSSNILEIQVDNRIISTPGDMAEVFNEHFTNTGQVPAHEVSAAEVNPEVYLAYTDKAFCLKTPCLDVVVNY